MKRKHYTDYTSDTSRAIAYRRMVKAKKRKEKMLGVLAFTMFFLAAGCVGNSDFDTAVAEGKINFPRETTYIICDVDETEVLEDGETSLAVIMQDGSIHDYTVTDAPEGYISEVCFKANDIDDFTSYEVVALR